MDDRVWFGEVVKRERPTEMTRLLCGGSGLGPIPIGLVWLVSTVLKGKEESGSGGFPPAHDVKIWTD